VTPGSHREARTQIDGASDDDDDDDIIYYHHHHHHHLLSAGYLYLYS